MKKIILTILIIAFICSCSTGIHKAVKDNDMIKVKISIAEGKVNHREERSNKTPLLLAAYYGYTDMVQYLCENGAEIDAQDKDGQSALIYSTNYRFEEITRILLQHGASIDLKDKQGHNALYYAKFNRHYRIVDLLETKGTDLE